MFVRGDTLELILVYTSTTTIYKREAQKKMFIEMLNREVRKEKGTIPNWVIARKLGIHENTWNRWMRQEMTGQRKTTVLAAITEIKTEMESVAQ